jgi:vancomycin permeability regulator SanA
VLFIISAIAIVWDGLVDDLETADVAIVLGNKVEIDGTPSARLQARLDKAVALYAQGMFDRIIVSGGTGREGYDEAEVMQRYLVAKGIPESNVYVDSEGNNTYLTARNSAIFMEEHGWKSAMVITQYFHISRSRLALKRFGISPVYSAHADYYDLRDVYSVGREVVAYLYYFIRAY